MENKYLDSTGLTHLCNKISQGFSSLGNLAADVDTLKNSTHIATFQGSLTQLKALSGPDSQPYNRKIVYVSVDCKYYYVWYGIITNADGTQGAGVNAYLLVNERDLEDKISPFKTAIGDEISTSNNRNIIARYPRADRLKTIMASSINSYSLTGTYYGYCITEGKFYSMSSTDTSTLTEVADFAAVGDVIGIYNSYCDLLSGYYKYNGSGPLEQIDTLQARTKLNEANNILLSQKLRALSN